MTALATRNFNLLSELQFIDYWDIDVLVNYSCADTSLEDLDADVSWDEWNADMFIDYWDINVLLDDQDADV